MKFLMNKILKITGLLILLVAMLYIATNKIFFSPNVKLNESKITIDIPHKIDIDSLAEILSPYLKSKQTFIWTARVKRFEKPKPGRYIISNEMDNNTLINLLRIGKRLEVNVTFNNQNSLADLAGAVARQIEPDSVELLRVMQDKDFIRKNGFTLKNILLMYVPNTYKMYYNTTAKQFRNRMLKEYHKFWNEKRKLLAQKQNLTPIKVGI
jgi:UPF0755 protein